MCIYRARGCYVKVMIIIASAEVIEIDHTSLATIQQSVKWSLDRNAVSALSL